MPNSSDQKPKLLYILKILREDTDENNSLTAEEIIRKLEFYGICAERKSIYGDVRVLKEFGYNIISKRGSKNPGFRLASREFELSELKLLVDAVQASKFITEKKSASLIKKLEGLTSKRQASELQNTVVMRDRIKTMNESVFAGVDTIHLAIGKCRQISFGYFDWDTKKQRVMRHGGKRYRVSPLALTWDDENYYLIAYDEKAEINKHFRVDKMLDIQITDTPSAVKNSAARFDTAGYSKKMFGMYGGTAAKIKLRCTNDLVGVIIDRFGTNVIITPDGDFFEVIIEAAVSPVLSAWVLQFGGKIIVVSPESVRQSVVDLAKANLELYK